LFTLYIYVVGFTLRSRSLFILRSVVVDCLPFCCDFVAGCLLIFAFTLRYVYSFAFPLFFDTLIVVVVSLLFIVVVTFTLFCFTFVVDVTFTFIVRSVLFVAFIVCCLLFVVVCSFTFVSLTFCRCLRSRCCLR